MPELPEVETVVRSLRRILINQTITKVQIKPTAFVIPGRAAFSSLIKDASFKAVRRRGKNILIDLSNDYTLWVHLKMTGHFYYLPPEEPVGRHDHVVFHLSGNDHLLRFNDYRRFGRLRLFPSDDIMQQKGLAELGPEPLEISPDDFARLLKSRRRMIKPALMDQSLIAGLGNIYADETLFLSRLHPQRLTDSISPKKLRELHGNIQAILKKAIRHMGTSVDSFAGVNGRPGGFQKYLQVYGRENQPCVRCGRLIIRKKIAGRSAHFCPACQRCK